MPEHDHDFRTVVLLGPRYHDGGVSDSRDNFDRRTYWALHALIVAVFLGTLFGSRVGNGFGLSLNQVIALVFGIVLYYVIFFQCGGSMAPRWVPVVFFSAQWALVFALIRFLPGNFLWLLILPVVAQSVRFHWSVVLLVSAIFLGTMAWMMRQHMSWSDTLANVLSISSSFAFVIVFTLATSRAFRAQKKSEELAAKLEEANAQLRATAVQSAELAAANERNRIARDIHDGLGHSLTVIAVQLQVAKTLIAANDLSRTNEAITRAEGLSRSALDEVRSSVSALRLAPAVSLSDALAGLVQQNGPDTFLEIKGALRVLPDETEQALFRAVQEGLTNVRKHARASRVKVRLEFENEKSVAISVVDNGEGSVQSAAAGFGLAGIRERASRLGGSMSAMKQPQRGFVLRVEIPG